MLVNSTNNRSLIVTSYNTISLVKDCEPSLLAKMVFLSCILSGCSITFSKFDLNSAAGSQLSSCQSSTLDVPFCATIFFLLLISGDVEVNPGPTDNQPALAATNSQPVPAAGSSQPLPAVQSIPATANSSMFIFNIILLIFAAGLALRKTCPKCQSLNHCRKSQCAECGYLFSSKKSDKIEMRSKKTMEMRELCKVNDRERKARKRAMRVILILNCIELVIDCTKLPREIMQVHNMILNCVELVIDCTKLPREIMCCNW